MAAARDDRARLVKAYFVYSAWAFCPWLLWRTCCDKNTCYDCRGRRGGNAVVRQYGAHDSLPYTCWQSKHLLLDASNQNLKALALREQALHGHRGLALQLVVVKT